MFFIFYTNIGMYNNLKTLRSISLGSVIIINRLDYLPSNNTYLAGVITFPQFSSYTSLLYTNSIRPYSISCCSQGIIVWYTTTHKYILEKKNLLGNFQYIGNIIISILLSAMMVKRYVS